MKRKFIRAVVLGSTLCGLIPISASAAVPGDYVYAGANVNVRETPDGEVIGILPYNAQSVLLEEDEYGWYKIQSGDVIGYVASQYLGDEPFSEGYTEATVNSNGLNIRTTKDESSNLLDVLDSGTSVEVTENYDGGQWVSVVTENETYGYVNADYVSLETYYPTAVKAEDIQSPSYEENSSYEEPTYIEPVYYVQPEYYYPEETETEVETDYYYENVETEDYYEETVETEYSVEEVDYSSYEIEDYYEETADESYEEDSYYDADEDIYYEETSVSDTSVGASIAATACNYIGCSYVWGATGPTTFDCSGLVSYVYNMYGISVPRTAANQYYSGTSIDVSTAVYTAGTLIFYHDLGHVAISLGDGTVVHASGSDVGVIVSDAYYSTPYGAVTYF